MNRMSEIQKKEITKQLKRDLKRKGERHPRIPRNIIEEMKLVDFFKNEALYYVDVEQYSYYAWVDHENGVVVDTRVEERRYRRH